MALYLCTGAAEGSPEVRQVALPEQGPMSQWRGLESLQCTKIWLDLTPKRGTS